MQPSVIIGKQAEIFCLWYDLSRKQVNTLSQSLCSNITKTLENVSSPFAVGVCNGGLHLVSVYKSMVVIRKMSII